MTTDEKLKEILERDYYVPDVSELCVGFEYSYKSFTNLSTFIIESLHDLEQAFYTLEDGNLYAKKLDAEDIKNFGFVEHIGDFDYVLGKYTLIKVNQYISIISEQKTLFREGVIKNKSELKRLFKQLKIC